MSKPDMPEQSSSQTNNGAGNANSRVLLSGLAASPGAALGPVVWRRNPKVEIHLRNIPAGEIEAEVVRLQAAIGQASEQLASLRSVTAERMSDEEAAVFDAHMAFLEDPSYTGEIEQRIRNSGRNAEAVVDEVTHEVAEMLANLPDEYLAARADDIRDVGNRLQLLLSGQTPMDPALIQPGSVVLAEELTPSELATFPEGVAAIVTARGSRTAHVVIMAKAWSIPAVVGLGEQLKTIPDGSMIVVDGDTGDVIVNPSDSEIADVRQQITHQSQVRQQATVLAKDPAVSRDGRTVEVWANVGNLKDISLALANGADGVGLFRTEFLYMDSDHWPTEEEQFRVYKGALEAFEGRPVVIRTLDVGGDKPLPYADLPKEDNPFLGYRAIRFCLDRPEIFKVQLRALLRASVYGQLWIMLPMIENRSEVEQARALLQECRQELENEGCQVADRVPLGIMVEIPAAAVNADVLARSADFMSIGTNDLTQYTLAADRGNERVAYLYNTIHPAVLRLVRMTCEAGQRARIPVGMCGELAGDVQMTEALLGLGLSEVSMSPGAIPLVKQRIRAISCTEAEPWALQLLELESPEGVRSAAAGRMGSDWVPLLPYVAEDGGSVLP